MNFLLELLFIGSWTGKKIIKKLSQEKFILLVEILLIISGLQLIWAAKRKRERKNNEGTIVPIKEITNFL